MPTGRAIFKSGTERPVAALKLLMKKSAYLKYARKEKLMITEIIMKIFFAF